MKRIQKILILMASVLFIMVMVPTSTEAASSTVKLNKKTLTLYAGGSTTLKMTGTAKKLTWSSSKKSVATVSAKGVVTAKKSGKAVITVKSGSKKATCKVTVKKRLSAKQAVAKYNSQMKKVRNITLKVYAGSVKPANYFLTIATNVDTKVTYMDMSAMDLPKMYYKGNKVYWYDASAKKWYYYTSSDGNSDIQVNPAGILITGDMKYKNAGVKTFNGKKCQALQVTIDGSPSIFYLDLADYSLVGVSEGQGKEKMVILFDTKTKVSIPSSVTKNATYKEYS
ncbi:MAG: Ig-like domain-containing protein [Lachnospiraceae bacterium]|nr:Ig-like domain-containing protein [Lachnospiraceae bacterium]MDE6251747.1 Ig-like domain-containing protein [Lachnospiraceae bacterium]